MILKYLDTELDGNSWEELSISCYKMKYKNNHFRAVPAEHEGDAGIEGYTRDGIVLQCYCPNDKNLSGDDLYKKQRDKVSKDIKKFLDPTYSKKYEKLGLIDVKEWHFVVPKYKDKRILEHLTTKENEVNTAKQSDLLKDSKKQIYKHIAQKFSIEIKIADDFKTEISSIIRKTIQETKINLAILDKKNINWENCDNTKINNVRRKLIAIDKSLAEDSSRLDRLLDIYMTSYISGVETLKNLGEVFPEIRKNLLDLIGAFKVEVEMRTLLNSNQQVNKELFDDLTREFTDTLKEEFTFFNSASIMELKMDIIAEWLADCSMEFKGDFVNE